MSPEVDPYAPPVHASAPEGRLWRIEENKLLVLDGAELPEIDLLESDLYESGALVREQRVFRTTTPLIGMVGMGPLGINFLHDHFKLQWPFWVRIGSYVLWFLVFFLGAFRLLSRKARISFHLSAITAKKRRQQGRLHAALAIGGFLLLPTPLLPGHILWPALTGFVLLLLSFFLNTYRNRWKIVHAGADGWISFPYIRPVVIRRLKRIQTTLETGISEPGP